LQFGESTPDVANENLTALLKHTFAQLSASSDNDTSDYGEMVTCFARLVYDGQAYVSDAEDERVAITPLCANVLHACDVCGVRCDTRILIAVKLAVLARVEQQHQVVCNKYVCYLIKRLKDMKMCTAVN
jgi:hypothetical protein